jgi:hypothetical protein
MAAFVPARRALTWQLTDPNGSPVVRERFWLTFQPGEIRTCTSCHGLNTRDQAGHAVPTNPPEALRRLLKAWKLNTGQVAAASAVEYQRSGPGQVAFRFVGLANAPYRIEVSTDLIAWTPVGTQTAASDGGIDFAVTAAQADDRRFYRLVYVGTPQ